MEGRYNTRSPAVKRLMKEAQELSEPTDQYYAQPLEDDLFEWHFTVRGPTDTEFQHGVYHGRIILPVDYPMKPPSIIWLTPNGRFETNKKICLSISGHHPESWQPSWSIRTALLAIIGFMPTHGGGAIGSLDYTPEERKVLAKRSREWKCPSCGDVQNVLLEPSVATTTGPSDEAKKLAAQINFQGEKPKNHCSTECLAQAKTQDASVSGAAAPTNIAAPDPQVPSQDNNGSQTPQPLASSAPVNFSSMFSPIHSWRMPPMAPGHHPTAVSMMPRFPYPPSHYQGGNMPGFFPTGYPMLPPGMFPPPCYMPPGMGRPAASVSSIPPLSPDMTTQPDESDTDVSSTLNQDKQEKDDDSLAAAAPLEADDADEAITAAGDAEQRADRANSRSMPELNQQSPNKRNGLRHRQSAAASVAPEVAEDGQQEAARADSQRIEANAGDRAAVRPRGARPVGPPVTLRPRVSEPQGWTYSSLVMVVMLSLAILCIFLRRMVVAMDTDVPL